MVAISAFPCPCLCNQAWKVRSKLARCRRVWGSANADNQANTSATETSAGSFRACCPRERKAACTLSIVLFDRFIARSATEYTSRCRGSAEVLELDRAAGGFPTRARPPEEVRDVPELLAEFGRAALLDVGTVRSASSLHPPMPCCCCAAGRRGFRSAVTGPRPAACPSVAAGSVWLFRCLLLAKFHLRCDRA